MAELSKPYNTAHPTLEEIASAIESSGYLIEARVARVLDDRGFFVQPNVFHLDPKDTTKTFEIDAVGRRGELVNPENGSAVVASVLVECKNNALPFAFLVQRQEIGELNENQIQYGGYPSFISEPETSVRVPLHKSLGMKEWHHYCKAVEVATQFCAIERDKKSDKKWTAEANERYTKSFSNLALAAVQDWEGMFGLHLECIQVQLTYPVAVFQGPICVVREKSGNAQVEYANHIQLHHVASLNGQLRGVQIDVVTEDEFPNLLATFESELEAFRDRVKSDYERLLKNALDQKYLASQIALTRAASRT
jgi:hypothetical protein